jgi:hypothetical protein
MTLSRYLLRLVGPSAEGTRSLQRHSRQWGELRLVSLLCACQPPLQRFMFGLAKQLPLPDAVVVVLVCVFLAVVLVVGLN